MMKAIPILLLLIVAAPLLSPGAESPFGIDLKELEGPKSSTPAVREREKTNRERRNVRKSRRDDHAVRAETKTEGYLRYTVKPGDHIYRILAGQPGMSDETAQRLVPEIIRINKISDIRNLTVGQTLLIPHQKRHREAGGREDAKGSKGELAAPPGVTLICPVPEHDPAATIDSLLTLLQLAPRRNETLSAGQESGAAFSITVDRYFEYKGGRYVVNIGESDASAYTLLRVLETAGYKVLRLTGREDYRGATVRLLTAVGVAPDFRRHLLQEGKGITGFLIRPEGAGGRRVVVSAERVDPGEKWLLAPGCGAR